MGKTLVTGEILLPAGASIKSSAVARVQLLDTSLADAPSVAIASQVVGAVATKLAKGGVLEFSLAAPNPDAQASYCVSVHIDQDGDGQIKPGDFVTTQSYPVITFGYPSRVRVQTVVVN